MVFIFIKKQFFYSKYKKLRSHLFLIKSIEKIILKNISLKKYINPHHIKFNIIKYLNI